MRETRKMRGNDSRVRASDNLDASIVNRHYRKTVNPVLQMD